jgi:hypothetical protein
MKRSHTLSGEGKIKFGIPLKRVRRYHASRKKNIERRMGVNRFILFPGEAKQKRLAKINYEAQNQDSVKPEA